jgi:hypothetical protein
MSRRPSSRRARKAREDRVGVILIAVALAVASVVAYFLYQRAQQRVELDKRSMCPVDGPQSVTVLLVDVTDELSPPQRQDMRNQLAAAQADIPQYGAFELFTVAPTSEALLTPVRAVCNPGKGADESDFSSNTKAILKRYREGFAEPLEVAFETIMTASDAERSPILQSIQSVALTAFGPIERRDVPRKLIVVSDLLQFTDDINFYKGLPTAEQLIASPAFLAARTDLRGVEVELWMITRVDHAKLQTKKLAELWAEIIAAQGGRVVRSYNIDG